MARKAAVRVPALGSLLPWNPEAIAQIRQEVGLGTMAQYKSRFKDICQEDQR